MDLANQNDLNNPLQEAIKLISILVINYQDYLRTLSLSKPIVDKCKEVLPCHPVLEILWCGHSDETSPVVFSDSGVCFSMVYEVKFVPFFFIKL